MHAFIKEIMKFFVTCNMEKNTVDWIIYEKYAIYTKLSYQ